MATVTKKDKFFDVLKNIFIGAKIEGESGYVNLMRIKSKYYHEFKDQLLADIDAKLNEVGKSFEEELYNKLYTFFKKYFSESGSIYFSYTPLHEKVYERIYRDDKDVMLFWKTHMLYYVKTERLYKNLEIQDEETNIFYLFDVSKLEHKKNNERKDLVFDFANAEFKDNKRQITLTVEYSKNGKKTKIDDILKQIKKATRVFNSLTEKQVERACGIFRKQSEVDYFINKNAKEFLREQFSLWIKGYLMDDETLFEADRLKQLKALQSIAFNIIDLVSQFEDELVKIWNKPKFAHSSNYVITLDKIADKDFALLEKIIKHEGIKNQIEEWQELRIVNKEFDIKKVTGNNAFGKQLKSNWQYLPIDTKYFKDLELDILALFDDLDNQLDGWLIHSENYQALNTLKNKFQKKFQTIYIDPPYNAPASEIIYINNYKHSSWLTLMENRIQSAKKLLANNGIFECAIDDNEIESLGLLLKNTFQDKDITCVSIVHNPSGTQSNDFSVTHEYTYVIYPKVATGRVINLEERDDENADIRNFMNTAKGSGSNYKRESGKTCFYPIIVKNNEIVDFGKVCQDDFHPGNPNIKKEDGTIEVYPIDNDGTERKWVFSRNTVEKIKNELFVKIINDETRIMRKKSLINYKTVWTDSKYSAKTYGTGLLKDLGLNDFDFPKSIYNTKDFIHLASDTDSYVLDFFPGSGTTAHAVIELNKQDGGNRKYVLTELGDHFKNVIIPRLKKITFSNTWKEGKPLSNGGFSHCFKYFTLEQYAETLSKLVYEDKNALPNQNIYHQYIFLKDLKQADKILKINEESKQIKVDLTKLHEHIDIPETLSHLTGKFIKQILRDKVIFTDGSEIDLNNIDYKIVKPLIWW
jgi:adenine-specific DNA-methyltransferase